MSLKDTPKQRLVELNIGEVSIVDEPANERPFNVIKNKEGKIMSNIVTAKKNLDAFAAEAFEIADAVEKAASADGVSPADLKSLTSQLVGMTQKLRAAVKALPADEKAAEKTDEEKAKEKLAAEAKEKAFPPAAAKKPDADGNGVPDDEEMKRAAQKNADAPMVSVGADGAVTIRADVAKAAASGAAIQALKCAAESTLTALAQANKEVAKAVMQGVIKAELSGDTSITFNSQVRPDALGEVPKLAQMSKKIEELESKVSSVEKSRSPSKSGGDGNNTDGEKPVKKSFWGGVL